MKVNDTAPLRMYIPGRNLSAAVSMEFRLRDPSGTESTLAAAAGAGVTDEWLGVLPANEYAEALFTPTLAGDWRYYLRETGASETRSSETFRFRIGEEFA